MRGSCWGTPHSSSWYADIKASSSAQVHRGSSAVIIQPLCVVPANPARVLSDRRNGTAIDHIFGARNAASPVGCKKGDHAGDFLRFRRSADRDSTEGVHDHLLALFN